MNFIFISPNFPHTYLNFCERLKENGATVLGIGDEAYDSLDWRLKNALTEYYKVDQGAGYDQFYRAVAYFAFKYGKPDWIESNNEYWLETDARLRTDFNVTTGVHSEQLKTWQSKSGMKQYYAKAGVPTARLIHVTDKEAMLDFAVLAGYPLFVKPDKGVGAEDSWKLDSEADVDRFFDEKPDVPYVCEEYITGNIYSYDCITDDSCEVLFESANVFPPSVADILHNQWDFNYHTLKTVPAQLSERGRAAAKAFGAARRFLHMEFFCLDRDKPGLGSKGDFVGLEVNVRPAGGYTPDMMNYAHSTDVYRIWAEMVTTGKRMLPVSTENCFCAYAARRDAHAYVHSHEEIVEKYGKDMVMMERMPDSLSGVMGNMMYMAKIADEQALHEYIRFILEKTDGTISPLP